MQEQKENAGAKKASISDYFKVIGVKRCFELDLDQLEKKYCQLQTVFHPDAIDKNNLSNVEMDVYLKKIKSKRISTKEADFSELEQINRRNCKCQKAKNIKKEFNNLLQHLMHFFLKALQEKLAMSFLI